MLKMISVAMLHLQLSNKKADSTYQKYKEDMPMFETRPNPNNLFDPAIQNTPKAANKNSQ